MNVPKKTDCPPRAPAKEHAGAENDDVTLTECLVVTPINGTHIVGPTFLRNVIVPVLDKVFRRSPPR